MAAMDMKGGEDEESDEGEDDCNWCEFIPLFICLAIFIALIIYVCVDFQSFIDMYKAMIVYIKEHPGEAVAIIIGIYILLIIFCFPVFQMHIIVAIAYCSVFDSFWKGFLVATSVIFLAMMLGALAAILLSRYLLADFLKRQIAKSKNKYARSFKTIDQEFVTNGIVMVALIRLMAINFGVVSYILGVTSVSILDYLIGTTVTIVYIILFVLIGCTIWEATAQDNDQKEGNNELPHESRNQLIIIICIEVAFTVIVTVIITILVIRKLDQAVEVQEAIEKSQRDIEETNRLMDENEPQLNTS